MENKLVTLASQAIYDKKGINILAIDVSNISTLTKAFVIAEGTSDRHVQALARNVYDALDEHGVSPIGMEGKATGEWVVLDYGDFIIHLFQPGFRDAYRLEEVWRAGSIIDIPLVITPPYKEPPCRSQ